MRICPKCDELIEDQFNACWKCGTSLDGISIIAESFDQSVDDDPSTVVASQIVSSTMMGRFEIADLVCRTIALLLFALAGYLTVVGFVLIGSAMSAAMDKGEAFFESMVMMLPAFSIWVIGILYWKKSASLAGRMVEKRSMQLADGPIDITHVMMVAYSTAGIFVLVEAMRDLFSVVNYAYRDVFASQEEIWTNRTTWCGIAELVLALWLILGSRGIVQAIYWLRTAPRHDLAGND
jgi:hypothetical protein